MQYQRVINHPFTFRVPGILQFELEAGRAAGSWMDSPLLHGPPGWPGPSSVPSEPRLPEVGADRMDTPLQILLCFVSENSEVPGPHLDEENTLSSEAAGAFG